MALDTPTEPRSGGIAHAVDIEVQIAASDGRTSYQDASPVPPSVPIVRPGSGIDSNGPDTISRHVRRWSPVADVPLAKLAAALIANRAILDLTDPPLEFAQLLGIERLATVSRACLDEAIEQAGTQPTEEGPA